ncbi:MAG: hypothetical protein KKB61_18410 [Alphaproteobacteria bacterium]|nr:hypothetical protein [Alphaproteobacteria bacterium]
MTGFFVELGLEHPFLPETLRTLDARAGADFIEQTLDVRVGRQAVLAEDVMRVARRFE